MILSAVSAANNVDLGGEGVGWRFVVARGGGETMRRMEDVNEETGPEEWRPWEKAPNICICLKSREHKSGAKVSDRDVGRSLQNFCLSMNSAGVSTRVRGGIGGVLREGRTVGGRDATKEERKVAEIVGAREDETVAGVVIFGFARQEVKKRRTTSSGGDGGNGNRGGGVTFV